MLKARCSGCAISAVPESRIREVREKGANPRTLDWPAPATGDVIEKKVINGQRVQAGQELYRIADHAHLWVIADVAESDLSAIKIGTRASVTVRAYPIAADRRRSDVHLSGAAGGDAERRACASKFPIPTGG